MLLNFPFIQIAGIHDAAEAQLITEAGATCLGFPLVLPVNKEDCTIRQAADIVATLPSKVCSVVITYLDQGQAIAELLRTVGADGVQLHGKISQVQMKILREELPEALIIKSLIVGRDESDALLAEMRDCEDSVDAFITDSHDPRTGASGATGTTHDWSVSRYLREQSSRPLILAGGLRAHNVAAAIEAVEPFGVDAHTGVEDASGRKSAELVSAFVKESLKAWQSRGVTGKV